MALSNLRSVVAALLVPLCLSTACGDPASTSTVASDGVAETPSFEEDTSCEATGDASPGSTVDASEQETDGFALAAEPGAACSDRPTRTREEVAEGLIAAETCLAASAAVIVLIRFPGILERLARVVKGADDKIAAVAQAVLRITGITLGKESAKLLVKVVELGAAGNVAKAMAKAYLKVCGRGLEEIAAAARDLPDAAGTVIGGVDDSRTRAGEIQLPSSSPIRVARECWESSSRGIFESKTEEAKKCCDARFGGGSADAQACRNNVQSISDVSGW